MFDSIFVLTGGGPGTATETLTYYNYTLAFRMLEMGKASALGVITLSESADSRSEHARVLTAYKARDRETVQKLHRAHIEAGFERLVAQALEKPPKR